MTGKLPSIIVIVYDNGCELLASAREKSAMEVGQLREFFRVVKGVFRMLYLSTDFLW